MTPATGPAAVPASTVLALLAAISETLTVPRPADRDGWELKQARVLGTRAAHLRGVLGAVGGDVEASLKSAARLIREETRRPLPYQPERRQ